MTAATSLADGPVFTSRDAGEALRSVAALLREAEYGEERAAGLLRAPSSGHLLRNPARYAFFSDHTRPAPADAPPSVLTSLFFLNRAVPDLWVHAALKPELTDLLQELALLTRSGDHYLGTASLTPYRSRFFLSDRLFDNPAPQQVVTRDAAELAMPPHASSLLALDAVDRIDGSFLDVGCGSGFLALNAGPGCGRVAGFDLNPRSVRFSRANALLNGRDVRFTVADFTDPTALGREVLGDTGRFGSLVFNSPTMPRIESDAGEFGQSTARQVLRRTAAVAPYVLRPGGTAHVLTVVEVPRSAGSAREVVEGWLTGTHAADVTVQEVDSPYLRVTERQLQDRRLDRQSLLSSGTAHAQQLLSALAARGTGSVVPVLVALRTSSTEGSRLP
ncbi:50S ribosomal protein L11 methyltransferase [Streptomyces sp. NPDC051561]|uniref:50S ribosomal protein L11 methyltransferase n=1 Tax=Streptomyces sp. NPDC051561 TaxID=3365658 RepID=UPI0037A1D384